jgi:hypothetical protein
MLRVGTNSVAGPIIPLVSCFAAMDIGRGQRLGIANAASSGLPAEALCLVFWLLSPETSGPTYL